MIDFEIENKLITPDELHEFELETGVSLPQDYKEYLLKYNGGSPLSYYLYFGEPDEGILLSGFKSIKYGASLVEQKDYLPPKHLSIGYTETGYLAMSLDEKEYGNIFIYYSEAELKLLAPSFTKFLEGLVDYTHLFE